jgi:hypothetical protein
MKVQNKSLSRYLKINKCLGKAQKIFKLKAFRNTILNYTYAGDGILTQNFLPWSFDIKQRSAYLDSFESIPSELTSIRNMHWRSHIVSTLAEMVKKVPGDFVECGTWYGVLAKTLCNQSELVANRDFYLVDPFGAPGFRMIGAYKIGSYEEDIFDIVKFRFRNDPCVRFIRGTVPECLDLIPSKKVALLMIDMNSGEPEIDALNFFWNKMPQGSIIYLDDYGQNFPELRKKIDFFLKDKIEKLLVFPTGQAFLLKH